MSRFTGDQVPSLVILDLDVSLTGEMVSEGLDVYTIIHTVCQCVNFLRVNSLRKYLSRKAVFSRESVPELGPAAGRGH